jgi:phage replication O-like protein O
MVKHHYTKIPNIFMDVWNKRLTGSACKVYLVIVRETVGYHRPEVSISIRDLMKKTALSDFAVQTALQELIENKIIIISGKGNFIEKKPTTYKILV